MKKTKERKGITLIALVVTMVILIILATVSINAVFSESGIIKKAQLVKDMQANVIKADEESMNALLEEYENSILESEKTFDTTAPNQATIVLSAIEMEKEESITATITQSDGESGVNIQVHL